MIYLATPYSNPDKAVRLARFEYACRIAGRLMAAGHVVFSPIAHTHPIAVRSDLPLDWEYWQRFDREFLKVSEKMVVVMMDGWRESKGISAEVLIAEELQIPIEFIEAE